MKTLKIAALGVAALGLAALPVAGSVFAVAPTLSHTDNINLTVDPTCTLGTITAGAYNGDDATDHDNGSYTNPISGTTTLGTWDGDTLSVAMTGGTSSENIGTTTFTVRCNNVAGYDLKAKAANANLTKTGSDANIPGAAPAADTSYWAFKLSDASTGGMSIESSYANFTAVPSATEATKIAGKTSAGNIDAGESVTVTYAAGISKTQESGAYTGSVTYSLVQL